MNEKVINRFFLLKTHRASTSQPKISSFKHLFCRNYLSLWIVGELLHFGIYLSLMGVSWVQPYDVRDVVVAWRGRMKKSWILGVWNMIPLAIW